MTVMTVAEDDHQPLYIRESRGWTDQEASDFKKEVERLKDLWYPSIESAPEITTRQALANLGEVYDSTNGFSRIKMESEARRQDSEQRKKRRLHKIELENRNLSLSLKTTSIQGLLQTTGNVAVYTVDLNQEQHATMKST